MINSVVWDTKRYSYHFIDQLSYTDIITQIGFQLSIPRRYSRNRSHNNKTINIAQNAPGLFIQSSGRYRRIFSEICIASPSCRVSRITVIRAQSVGQCQQERSRCLMSASISIERSRRSRRANSVEILSVLMIYLELPFVRIPINESRPEEQVQERQPIRNGGDTRRYYGRRNRKSLSSDTRASTTTLFRVAASAAVVVIVVVARRYGRLEQTGVLTLYPF